MYSQQPRSERSLPLAPPAEAPAPERPRRGSGVLRFLRDVLVILVAAVVISFLIKTFLIRSFYIPSESMESAPRSASPLAPNSWGRPSRPVAHSMTRCDGTHPLLPLRW